MRGRPHRAAHQRTQHDFQVLLTPDDQLARHTTTLTTTTEYDSRGSCTRIGSQALAEVYWRVSGWWIGTTG